MVSIGGDRPRNWLLLIVSAWVAVLLAGIGWAVVRGRPTDREQTTVAAALPYVDAAASRIAATAEADGQAVSVVSGFDKVGDCKVSLVRPGQRFQRVVTVLVAPGTEGAAFQRIAARLPASYKVTVRTAPLPSLVGDAGLFVRIVGNKAGDGVLRIALDTGSCRSLGPLLVPTPPPGNRTAVAPAFERLGLTPVQTMVFAVPCTRGPGQLSTVESLGRTTRWRWRLTFHPHWTDWVHRSCPRRSCTPTGPATPPSGYGWRTTAWWSAPPRAAPANRPAPVRRPRGPPRRRRRRRRSGCRG